MKLAEFFLGQLEREALLSPKALERVPEGRPEWKPHDKSMPLGYLSNLVATMIVRPGEGDSLPPGMHSITGWAWSAWPIARVEVSGDGGASWRPARLEDRSTERTWQGFSFDWAVSVPGRYEIRCRAADRRGRIQPEEGRNRIDRITVRVE